MTRTAKATTPLVSLVKRHQHRIAVALALVVVEHVAWIAEPALFGLLLDALIERAGDSTIPLASTLFPLSLWVGVFVLNSGSGVVRRVVEPRIYLRMFTQLATEIATTASQKHYRVSKTAALAQLSEQYVTFFQYRLPDIIEQIIEISGAVIALAAFDWRISLTCLTIVVPLLAINQLYNRHVVAIQKDFHDTVEGTFDVFSTQNPEEVRSYYERSSYFRRRIANWGAFNFGVMRIFLLGIFLVVLWIAIDMDEFTTGSIYAIVAYIWTFVTSSEYIPELMESWTSLKDITRRLRAASL